MFFVEQPRRDSHATGEGYTLTCQQAVAKPALHAAWTGDL
jgi:hypothetical protein